MITSFVSRIREFGIPLGESGRGAARFFASAVGGTVLGVAIAFGLAYLFQSPARVQALWQRALRPAPAKKKSKKDPAPEAAAPLKSGPSEVREVDAPKDAYAPPLAAEPPPPYAVPFNQALVPTFAYLAVLGVTSSAIAAKVSLTFSIPTIAIAAALVLDAIDAARFLAKHGPAASVRAETRAFASDVALHVLQTTEIPAHARGRHLAVLLQVFPFTPVQILVPEAHAKTALKTLDRALGGSTRALPRNGTTASGAAG